MATSTATVTVSEPVISIRDYNRDGDVDMKDFAKIELCGDYCFHLRSETLRDTTELKEERDQGDVDEH